MLSIIRTRMPKKREKRRTRKEFSEFKELQRARGILFNAGIAEGRSGRVLTHYVNKQISLATA